MCLLTTAHHVAEAVSPISCCAVFMHKNRVVDFVWSDYLAKCCNKPGSTRPTELNEYNYIITKLCVLPFVVQTAHVDMNQETCKYFRLAIPCGTRIL